MADIEIIKHILNKALKQESEDAYYFLNYLVKGYSDDFYSQDMAYNPILVKGHNLVAIVNRGVDSRDEVHLEISFKEVSQVTDHMFILDMDNPFTVYHPWFREFSIDKSLIRVKSCAKSCRFDDKGELRVENGMIHHSIVFDLINRKMWSETDKSVEESINAISVYGFEGRPLSLERDKMIQSLKDVKANNKKLYRALDDCGLYELLLNGHTADCEHSYLLFYSVIKNPSMALLFKSSQFSLNTVYHIVNGVINQKQGCSFIDKEFAQGDDVYCVMNTEPTWRPLLETDEENYNVIEQIKFRNNQLNYLASISGVNDYIRMKVLFDWMMMGRRDYKISLGKLKRLARDNVNIPALIDYVQTQEMKYGLRDVKGMETYYQYYVMHYLLHGEYPSQFPPILRTAYDALEKRIYGDLETGRLLRENTDISKRIAMMRSDLKAIIDGFEFIPVNNFHYPSDHAALEEVDKYGYESVSISSADGKFIGGLRVINVTMSGDCIVRINLHKAPKELLDAIAKWVDLHQLVIVES